MFPMASSLKATLWYAVVVIPAVLAAFSTVADEKQRLKGVAYLGDLPTLVADHEGFFTEQGLELAVSQERSGMENLKALRAGEADYALMALTPFILDRLNRDQSASDDEPVILAGISHSIGLNYIVYRKDGGIDTPGDLEDRSVGVMQGTNAELLLSFFLRYHGVPSDTVSLVNHPTNEVMTALRDGEIDVGVLWEPWVSRLEEADPDGFGRFPVSNVYTARWVLVTRQSVVTDRAEEVRQVLEGYQNAIDYMTREPQRAAQLYAERFNVDPETVLDQRDHLIYGMSLDWSLLTGMNQQLSWAREAGHAPSDTPADLLSAIAMEPLRSLESAAVTLPSGREHR